MTPRFLLAFMMVGFLCHSEIAAAARVRQITFGSGVFNFSTDPPEVYISPDGREVAILFDIDPDNNSLRYELFFVSFDGSNFLQPLTPFPRISSVLPGCYSADGSLFSFVGGISSLTEGPFWVINRDGTGLKALSPKGAAGGSFSCLTADGQWAIYSSVSDFLGTNPEGDVEIYKTHIPTGQIIQVTNDSILEGVKASSGDFNVLVTEQLDAVDFDVELFVLDGNGGNRVRLTDNTAQDTSPVISRDGSLVAFFRGVARENIFTILPDGTNEQQITFNSAITDGTTSVALSADGAKMLYGNKVTFRNVITHYLGNSDGTGMKPITPSAPGWLPLHFSDLDGTGTRAVFSMVRVMTALEDSLDFAEVFAYDDTIGTTPLGADVVVPIDTDLMLTFAEVTSAGETGAVISTTGLKPGPTDNFGNPPLRFDVTTTAVFTGSVELCFLYGNRLGTQWARVLHRVGDAWEDITSAIDGNSTTVCGITDSLSEFALTESATKPQLNPKKITSLPLDNSSNIFNGGTCTARPLDDRDSPAPIRSNNAIIFLVTSLLFLCNRLIYRPAQQRGTL